MQNNNLDNNNLENNNLENSNLENKIDKLELLNQLSKLKRKEKKNTRKRIKNVESLVKDNNNNIFDYLDGKNNKLVDLNNNILVNNKQDRASLFEDYKILLDGYPTKKRVNKPCINCGIDKILIYTDGTYACIKCGEVENCIIESEVSNYKDPMIEKPTFPYKRKNHFCELKITILTARKSKYSILIVKNIY